MLGNYNYFAWAFYFSKKKNYSLRKYDVSLENITCPKKTNSSLRKCVFFRSEICLLQRKLIVRFGSLTLLIEFMVWLQKKILEARIRRWRSAFPPVPQAPFAQIYYYIYICIYIYIYIHTCDAGEWFKQQIQLL